MLQRVIVVLIIVFSFLSAAAQEKPGLSEGDLKSHTYYFEIVDGVPTGDGAGFLKSEFSKNQFVLLGEYHGSYQISKFTTSMIPLLHDAGFRNFALEVGPVSAEILTEFSSLPRETAKNLNRFNTSFLMESKGRAYTPIPFFGNLEDAEFLAAAAERKWKLFGLDQEFSFGYSALLQRAFDNLSAKQQAAHRLDFEKAKSELAQLYIDDEKPNANKYRAILDSAAINSFLKDASGLNPKNKAITEEIRTSAEIYDLNRVRRWYEANKKRIDLMKRNLSDSMMRLKLDTKKDKVLLKMGAVHTGRGFSPLSLFEIGNTFSELAEISGKRSLHLTFDSRFYLEAGVEKDALEDPKSFPYRFAALLQMSKRDKWTVIDLRPLRSDVFYARKFKLDEVIWDIFKNHDLYIMPPTDKDPTPNYDKKKK
jgi:hypothetical protein